MSKISDALKELMGSAGPKETPESPPKNTQAVPGELDITATVESALSEAAAAQVPVTVTDPVLPPEPGPEWVSQPDEKVLPAPVLPQAINLQESLSPQPEAPAAGSQTPLELGALVDETVAGLVKQQVQVSVESAIQEAIDLAKPKLNAMVVNAVGEVKGPADPSSAPVAPLAKKTGPGGKRETRPHAFVIMPFGKKQGFDGTLIDFNAIYQDLIKPALDEAGFEPFRADEETTTGDILTDMFQELLLADLAICDLSIDNANVFYELGIRHAFRKRGIIHIQSGRAYMPFDIFNVRTIPYHTTEQGLPDPEHREKDIQAIARVCRDTWASDRDAIHSPVFNLLTGLIEPDRRTLRTPLATGFWREYNEWRQRVTVAQRQKRIGDVMLLTDEISNPLIKEEAVSEAGRAMRDMGRHELALAQYRQGLEINPGNAFFRREEAFHLNRLDRVDEAIVKLENLLQDDPRDSQAIAYLARIYKDMWTDSWMEIADQEKRIAEAYEASHWLVRTIHTYLQGYYQDFNNYYPGINALTLAIILQQLAERFGEDDDPDVLEIQELLPQLRGALQLSLERLARDEGSDYWTLVSLADLMVVVTEDVRQVKRAYKRALTAARKNVVNLESSLAQLNIFELLAIRPDFVAVGKQVLRDEIRRIRKEEADEDELDDRRVRAEQVFLFVGHRIDPHGSKLRRFPLEMEKEAAKRINAALEKFKAVEGDLAVTTGAASGGDILFIEACLQRGLRVEIHLPISEPDYVAANVGDDWKDRFYSLRNHPNVNIRMQEDHVGRVKPGDNAYERNNRWSLYSSLIGGIGRLRLIALWDGLSATAKDQDGKLVSHMVEEMRRMGGYIEHLNTTKFDYWQAGGKVGQALDKLAGL
ncbi:MAG: DUF4071 domain-containing protein [Anaerolineales bacterium]|nr:DUF4071 domain-containing protein [Anaerolineales bacterium]